MKFGIFAEIFCFGHFRSERVKILPINVVVHLVEQVVPLAQSYGLKPHENLRFYLPFFATV